VRELLCPSCRATILVIEGPSSLRLENLLVAGGRAACMRCGKPIPPGTALYRLLAELCAADK